MHSRVLVTSSSYYASRAFLEPCLDCTRARIEIWSRCWAFAVDLSGASWAVCNRTNILVERVVDINRRVEASDVPGVGAKLTHKFPGTAPRKKELLLTHIQSHIHPHIHNSFTSMVHFCFRHFRPILAHETLHKDSSLCPFINKTLGSYEPLIIQQSCLSLSPAYSSHINSLKELLIDCKDSASKARHRLTDVRLATILMHPL